jgi:hypothetical protein
VEVGEWFFSELVLRVLRKVSSGSPQSKVLAKGLGTLRNRERFGFLLLVKRKGNWRN